VSLGGYDHPVRLPGLSADAGEDAPAAPRERRAVPASVRWLPTALLGLSAVAFLALLVGTGYLGRYVRPTSDDWCMAAKERDWGVGGIVHESYYHLNGRIANAFMSGVVYMGGGWVTKVLPAVLYVGLAVGTAWLAHLLFTRLSISRVTAMTAAAATGLVVAGTTAWGAHSPYAVVYWSAGTISHTLPSVLTVVVAAAALTFRGRWVPWAIVLFVVGWIDATLSEAFMATCGTVLVVVVAYHLLYGPRWGRTVRLSVAGLAGLVAGILVLYTSPGASSRRDVLTGKSLSATGAAKRAVHVLPHMLHESFNARVLVPVFALGVLLALLLPAVALTRRAFTWIVAGCVVLPFVMVFEVAVLLGMGYGFNGWAFSRVWQDFLIPATLAFLLGSYLVAGRLLSALAPRVRLSPAVLAAAAVVPVVALMYAAHSHADTARNIDHQMAHRAAAWDAQSARIKTEVAGGAVFVNYKPLQIAGLAEPFKLKPWRRDQIGQCAATYYHVDQLFPPPPKSELGG